MSLLRLRVGAPKVKRWIVAAVLVLPTVVAASGWKLTTTKDRLTDVKVSTFEAVSDNAFSFAFPYRGSTRARIAVRFKGGDDRDVILLIERGQLMHDTRDGEVRVRFDEGEVETFSTSPSTSRDSHIAFLGGEQRFIERVAKAKRLRVEFAVYSNGTHVADFRFAKPLPIPSAEKLGPRQQRDAPSTGDEAPMGVTSDARASRLAAREDECRSKKEPIECLEVVRACYQKVRSIEDEADCQDQVERFTK